MNTVSQKNIFDEFGKKFNNEFINEYNQKYNTNYKVTLVENVDETYQPLVSSYSVEIAQDLKQEFAANAEHELLKILFGHITKQVKSNDISIGIKAKAAKAIDNDTFEPHLAISFMVKAN